MKNFLTAANDIERIILTEKGEEKLRAAIRYYLKESSDGLTSLKYKKESVFDWYRSSNAYEFYYHEHNFPGVIVISTGGGHQDGIFDNVEQKVFIPWTDIEDVIFN